MKLGTYVLRAYFLIAGIAGLLNAVNTWRFEVQVGILSITSTIVLVFISVCFLVFAVKFESLVIKAKTFIQVIIGLLYLNYVATFYLGSKGLNQVNTLEDMPPLGVVIAALVGLVFYSALIYAVEYIHRKKVKS